MLAALHCPHGDLSSELSSHWRLIGRKRGELPARPEHPDLATLQTIADLSATGLATLESVLPGPATMIETIDGLRAAATFLTQLVMHGVEHRAHVGTILGANGMELPDLDSWAHGIRVHGDARPPDWRPEPAVR